MQSFEVPYPPPNVHDRAALGSIICMIHHLDPTQIKRGADDAGLAAATQRGLLEAARAIAADPALREASAEVCHVVFETEDDFAEALKRAKQQLGARTGAWNALMLLESARLVRERQSARGVPADVSRAVNERHAFAWLRRAERDGRCEPEDWLPMWFRLVASGLLYRLGRLEFAPERWSAPFSAYRCDASGELVLLANAGVRFSREGLRVGELVWSATLDEGPSGVVGFPIDPRGRALAQPVRLPFPEWRAALTASDVVLDLHVPAEGELGLEPLRDALERAVGFFEKFHPDPPFSAYHCDSWLFSDQLEASLGVDSNIVRWQHEGYLFPTTLPPQWVLEFIFGAPTIDPATAPRNTRLRRAIIEQMERGEAPRGGGYLLLRQDLERFGAQPYRRTFASTLARLEAVSEVEPR